MCTQLSYWLALLHTDISLKRIYDWLDIFQNIELLFHSDVNQLSSVGLTTREIKKIKNPQWSKVEQDLIWQQSCQNRFIIRYDESSYPELLRHIAVPPLLLFVEGNRAALNQTQLAMVGSRYPSYAGQKTATFFAQTLANAGLIITSGFAKGIDAASHRAALQTKSPTVAVFGTGIRQRYPRDHAALAEEILQTEGTLISEFSLDTPPLAMNFPRRNRIIAGLSRAVLVVEAALKSGSLITARLAAEAGRDVFAIPNSIYQIRARGCHALIKQGAALIESPEEILWSLGWQHVQPEQNPIPMSQLTPKESIVLAQIEYEITSMDVIILRSQLTGGEVSSILLRLELQGLILSVPGGYVRSN